MLSEDYYIQYASACSEKTFINNSKQMCAVYRVNKELHTTKTETLLATTKSQTQSREYNNENKSTESMLTTPDTSTAQNGGKLEIWIYVLTGVAVVIALLLTTLLFIVCAIICICLRRSKVNQRKLLYNNIIAKPCQNM